MMAPVAAPDQTAAEYDRLAPYYDAFTAGYAYERWFTEIEKRAVALGLDGHHALDLACGTGKSTAPLLAHGYAVVGCDISAGMVRQAQRNFPEHEHRFLVADMRDLPWLGEFDLILCLDDAVNYLLSEDELQSAFRGVAAALAPQGVFVFDVNSLFTYRTAFATTSVREDAGNLFAWRGEGSSTMQPGELASATVEIFAAGDGPRRRRTAMRHLQRHYSAAVIRDSLAAADLECAATFGQQRGARLEDRVDEETQIKLVFFARHRQEWR